MSLIGLLLALVVVAVLVWGAQRIMAVLPIPEPIRTVLYVLLVLVVVLWFVAALTGTWVDPVFRVR